MLMRHVIVTAYARNGAFCRFHRRLPQFRASTCLTSGIIIGLIRAARIHEVGVHRGVAARPAVLTGESRSR